jgi:hypothetical protein
MDLPSVIVAPDPPPPAAFRNEPTLILGTTVRRLRTLSIPKRTKVGTLLVLAASILVFVAGVTRYITSRPSTAMLDLPKPSQFFQP